MEKQFLISTLVHLLINLIYTVLALIIGLAALIIVDKKILKRLDVEHELKEGNLAVALFASTILLFVALIVSIGLKG